MTTAIFPQHGGCHCRALRFTLSQPPLNVYACHCTDCQTLSGGAFGVGATVLSAGFSLTGTPRLVQRVVGSGRTSNRWICPECGVWLCGDSRLDPVLGQEKRVLRAGTLDDTSWLRPTIHFWTRSAQPWVVFPQGATLYQTQP